MFSDAVKGLVNISNTFLLWSLPDHFSFRQFIILNNATKYQCLYLENIGICFNMVLILFRSKT